MPHKLRQSSKKSVPSISVVLCLTLLFSCGPSAEEKTKLATAQKAREDSIRIAAETETKLRMEQKLLLEDSLLEEQAMVDGMNNRLTYFQTDLVAAKDKLEVIKQPQFLRTPAEREQQIRNQALIISDIEREINRLRQELETRNSIIKKLESSILTLMR